MAKASILFMDEAVFASAACALRNSSAKRSADITSHEKGSDAL
jgi:hypothetical protein